ncbi:MAG: tRNA preQ1(34) S-adenosylmethionine ribosyltransferase-isomerase QueA [Deltaproteobacteria bacterium]|nr:MAG: tRNA preQ1(34) S-adenosylmethionine ribosyltransferase-isomerase QueA [Deltaproteobacteria bacterium]
MYQLADYAFTLPEDRIAQSPSADRQQSRLMRLSRTGGGVTHHRFADLPDLLDPSDVLVVNTTRVIPARLFGRKPTGGAVEMLIIDYAEGKRYLDAGQPFECDCMMRASKRPRPGTRIALDGGCTAEVIAHKEKQARVRFFPETDFDDWLDRSGHMPLPPYIRRQDSASDRARYQTVYAAHPGAVAAPTAGLHFTPELFSRLADKGIAVAPITLHVGYGTFVPVQVADIRDHEMHGETYTVPEASAHTIETARAQGRRIVAVGTTSVRTLEYVARETGRVAAGTGVCDLFIYPGYDFSVVDAIITNFHLPGSTLIMLIAAFAGRERVLSAYQEAIDTGYRFYSYGDAMLLA